ncbi:MAG: agmatinase [Dehalococcoidia bacterium]|nr:agmatinase [Dehalococcoidia bacterium]
MGVADLTPFPPSVPWSFAAVGSEETNLKDCRVVVVPVPYDSTTSYKGGSREGPRAIIEASRYLEDYDIALGREIYQVGIHTLPEIEPHVGGPENMVERVRATVQPLAKDGKLVAVLGGEHSVSVGVVKALREVHDDLSVLYLDAHGDLRNEYMGSGLSHACAARRILEMCPLVEVGIRSISKEEMSFIQGEGREDLKVYLHREGDSKASWDVEGVLKGLSERVYVSIDLDVLDPSLMPAVGTPEPGGLGWESVLSLLEAVCRERSIVGFDIMELCPVAGPPSCAFVAAKLAYKVMGYATERS